MRYGLWRRATLMCTLIGALAMQTATPSAQAQVFAERTPDDAVLYVSWEGADALGEEWEQSHLKGLLDAWPALGELIDLAIEDIAGTQFDDPEQGEQALRELVDAALQRPWAFYLASADAADGVQTTAAFIMDAGDAADQLDQTLAGFAEDVPEVVLMRDGHHLVLHAVDLAPQRLALLRGDADAAPALADAELFDEAVDRLHADPSLTSWLAMERLGPMLEHAFNGDPAQGPPRPTWSDIMRAAGLDRTRYVIYAGGLDGRMWRDTTFVDAPAPRRGALGLFGDEPLDEQVLQQPHADAEWVVGLNLAVDRIGDVLKQFMLLDPFMDERDVDRELQDMREDMAETLGFDPAVLPELFGDQWLVIQDDALAGPMAPVGALVMNWPRDAGELAQRFDTLADRPPDADGFGRPPVQRDEIDGSTVYRLPMPGFAPAWMVHEQRVILGLPGDALQARLDAEREEFPRLIEDASYDELAQRLDMREAAFFQYIDLEATVPEFLQMMQMVLQQMGDPDAAGYLPDIDALRPHLVPVLGYWRADEDGLFADQLGPFPGMDSFNPAVAGVAVGIMLPALHRARGEALKIASASNLRQVGIAVTVWAHDHDEQLPPSFGALYEDAYLVEPGIVVNPRLGGPDPPAFEEFDDRAELAAWVDEHSDYVYRPEAEFGARGAEGILAYERPAPELTDGLNILYIDGSVQFHAMPEAARLLREAGEDADLPDAEPVAPPGPPALPPQSE